MRCECRWAARPSLCAGPPSPTNGGTCPTAAGGIRAPDMDELFLLLATGTRFLQMILVERVSVVRCPVSDLFQRVSTFDRQVANTSFHCPSRACWPAMAAGSVPLVGRGDFWAKHDARPPLDASETGRFTPVYGCSKNTRITAIYCHNLLCSFVHITWRASFLMSNRHGRIGSDVGVLKHCKTSWQ